MLSSDRFGGKRIALNSPYHTGKKMVSKGLTVKHLRLVGRGEK